RNPGARSSRPRRRGPRGSSWPEARPGRERSRRRGSPRARPRRPLPSEKPFPNPSLGEPYTVRSERPPRVPHRRDGYIARRPMNIVVLAKYVPEPLGTPRLGPDNLLVRSGVDGALDPGDEYGLELGLQLVEAHGGEVTVVSMGPEEAAAAVQRALAMGADRAVMDADASLR